MRNRDCFYGSFEKMRGEALYAWKPRPGLSGYDIDRGVVTLADPTYGIVERSMEEFVTYYQKYYYQAVVVR